MQLKSLLLAACAALALPLTSTGDPPRAGPALLVGKWSVEFSNGVVEKVGIKKDGTATVTEPARASDGKATALQGSFLVVYDDDRVERWTPVGKRVVVEHWFPASQFPNGSPVRGIADITD